MSNQHSNKIYTLPIPNKKSYKHYPHNDVYEFKIIKNKKIIVEYFKYFDTYRDLRKNKTMHWRLHTISDSILIQEGVVIIWNENPFKLNGDFTNSNF
jgi:hypothetical protein